MVVDLDRDASRFQGQHDPAADILQGVGRRNGEVTTFGLDLSAQVRLKVLAALPPAFVAIDKVVGRVDSTAVAHVSEQEKLGFRAPIAGLGDAGLLEVGFRFLGHVARVTRVGLAGNRLKNIADHHQGGHSQLGVDKGGGRIKHQQHIRLMDFFETADRRAIEANPFFEQFS